MAELSLYIGNKNYSSRSLRAWMLLRHLELPFREVQLLLEAPDFPETLARMGAADKISVLVDGERVVWDSLAICEYVMEIAGRGPPGDTHARAVTRCVTTQRF